jgi:hypothetical protein
MKVRPRSGEIIRHGTIDWSDIGEVLSFWISEDGTVYFNVAFYGYPGTYEVSASQVESLVD